MNDQNITTTLLSSSNNTGHIMAYTGHIMANTGHIMAYNGHIMAYTGHVMAYTGHIMAYTGHVMAYTGHIVAYTGHVMAYTGHVMAYNGHVMAYNGHVMAYNGHVMAYNGHVIIWSIDASNVELNWGTKRSNEYHCLYDLRQKNRGSLVVYQKLTFIFPITMLAQNACRLHNIISTTTQSLKETSFLCSKVLNCFNCIASWAVVTIPVTMQWSIKIQVCERLYIDPN